jgi:GTP-binding protein
LFIDYVHITAHAGQGGHGAVSFHREKYVAAGGPDGGDGGRGGGIVLRPDGHLSTLLDFRYQRKYAAENGQNGQSGCRFGKDGQDLIVKVPPGTVVRDKATGAVIRDMSEGGDFLLCKGGRGGWGNKHFATPTRQCPRFAKSGLPGQSREITLELKLLADVGLVGLPNAGKSSLLGALTAATPKIGAYPFTTLSPNLGVARTRWGTSFVLADIPGLIEGASEGAGLGHEFLRHVERCRLLVHLVDSFDGDAVSHYRTVNAELYAHDPALRERPQLVCASKADLLDAEARETLLAPLRAAAEADGRRFFVLSAASREGLDALTDHIGQLLDSLPPVRRFEPDYVPPEPEFDAKHTDIRREDGTWIVEGAWIARLMNDINFGDYESRTYFDAQLKRGGVYEQLEALGVQENDTVSIYDLEFEYKR